MATRTLTIALTMYAGASLPAIEETPTLPASSRIRELLITTNTPSDLLYCFIGLSPTPDRTYTPSTEGATPLFSYLGAYLDGYEGYIRLLANTTHLTELDLPTNGNHLYAIIRNNMPMTDAQVDIYITITVNETEQL